eukprot:GHVR01068619.1.p2 GENE.GHVR01068619.1~~GHVR01068619.1.p2  ORF type:complete len:198 (-),score=23.59 GHVR01068619.1:1707-2300(-)
MLHGMVLSQDQQLRRTQIESNEDALMYLNADAQCTMTTMPPGPTNRVWCKALIKPTGSFYNKLDEDDSTVEAFRVKYKAFNLSFTTPMPDENDTRVADLVFTTTDKEMNGYLSKFKVEDRKFVKGVLNKVEQELTVDTEDAEKYVMLVSKLSFTSTAGPRDFPSLVSNSRAKFNALKNEKDHEALQQADKKRKISES